MIGFIRKVVAGALLLAALCAAGYWHVASRGLPPSAVAMRVNYPSPGLTGTIAPLTFEAFLKDADRQNFLDSGTRAGLVSSRLEWSHSSLAWTQDQGFEERQAGLARARRGLARRELTALIADLRSSDAAAREVSSKELRIRTGQSFGYAYDAPEADREKAAVLWERWWGDEANRAQYGAKRVLDFADGALDTLRKAIGEPKPPPASGEDRKPAAPPTSATPKGGARY